MDINLIVPNAAQQGSAMSSQARGTELPVQRKSDVQLAPVKVAAVEKPETRLSEDERHARVKEAAKVYFKDVFVVNDTTFAIFKDGSGQYITRFTNMRDGSVTYIPEPDVLQYMASKGAQRKAIYDIDA